ncbi:MAG: hypothetical protein IKQ56_06965 [Lachnospiraceae bacterium]|nr:hypothetical protein [Lachnospiraceae bacterium]
MGRVGTENNADNGLQENGFGQGRPGGNIDIVYLQRQMQLHEIYSAGVRRNQENFAKNVGIGRDEFVMKARELGWGFAPQNDVPGAQGQFTNDIAVLDAVYELAVDSGNEHLISLVQKIMTTDVSDNASRKALAEDIRKGAGEFVANPDYPDSEKNKLAVVPGLKPELTEHERQQVHHDYEREKERRRKAAQDIEDRLFFEDKLRENGWKEQDISLARDIYKVYKMSLKGENTSALDGIIWEMLETPLDPEMYYASRNKLLSSFKDTMNNITELAGDDRRKLDGSIANYLVQSQEAENKELQNRAEKEAQAAAAKDAKKRFDELRKSFDIDIKDVQQGSREHDGGSIDIAARLDNTDNTPAFVQELFRLTEKDFKDIGSNENELAKAKELNEKLDALSAQPEGNMQPNAVTEKRKVQEQIYNLFLSVAEKNVKAWEYSDSKLPDWMRSTGAVGTIDQVLRVYGDRFSAFDKARLLKQRQVTLKSKGINKEQAAGMHDGRYAVVSDGQGSAKLDQIHQDSFQNTANGCWASSMTMLVKSRGVDNVNQFDIRSFRPGYQGKEIRDKLSTEDVYNTEVYKNMTTDKSNNIMDRGDAFLSLAPGSMLQGLEISGYSDDIRRMGISREEYLKRTNKVVSEHILHAIKEEKSPVSFIAGGHYITITGIDKNGLVTYKESKNKNDGKSSDADRTISLNNLLKKVISPASLSVRMEWAADIKLSKDGKKLYGIPSEYLSVAENGEILMPSSLETMANLENSFLKKDGFYVSRMNGSEGPDAQANLEHNLKTGGVNMRQIAYMPKQLNMKVLKKQAEQRTNEEEKRLKEMSGKFFGVQYKENIPEQTRKTVAEEYKKIESAFNNSIIDKQNAAGARLADKVKKVKQPLPAVNGSVQGKYDSFINRICKKAAASDKLYKDGKIKVIANAVAAAMLKTDGVPFNEKKIAELGKKINEFTDLRFLEFKDVTAILNNPNLTAVADTLQKDVADAMYRVDPAYRKGYIEEMKLLASNMLTKTDRTDKYKAFYDAVQDASKIDINAENADELIVNANRKLMKNLEVYIAGKEKVRTSTGGQDRFNNAMDAASILAAYAPVSQSVKINNMVANINKARGAKKRTDPKYVSMRNHGGHRAKARACEIEAAKNKSRSAKKQAPSMA